MNILTLAMNLIVAGRKSSLSAFGVYASCLGAKPRQELGRVLDMALTSMDEMTTTSAPEAARLKEAREWVTSARGMLF